MVKEQHKKAVFSLSFTNAFLQHVKKLEQSKGEALFGNGIYMHFYTVFQIICLIRDNEMSTQYIAETHRDILGRGINQSSLSRTLGILDEKLKLIKYTDEVFNTSNDKRHTYVELTRQGKELQKLFLGTTGTKEPFVYKSKNLLTA